MIHSQLHALVFPFPLQGHISPLLQLSQHLAASHGFLITFVNTEANHASSLRAHSKLQRPAASADASARVKMLSLSDGLPFNADRKPSDFSEVVRSMPGHMTPLLEGIISDSRQTSSPITCVIADLFLPWMHDLAKRAGVPAFVGFHASSIGQFFSLFHLPRLISTAQLNLDGSFNVDTITGIPGIRSVSVSTCYAWSTKEPAQRESVFQALASVKGYAQQLDAVIFNSFTELEEEAMDTLIKQAGSETKWLPIGPTVLLNNSVDSEDGGACRANLSVQEEECLDWLDTKPKGSVLYVAFGTTAWLEGRDLHALAHGIEASRATFLWVLRADLLIGESVCLPEGFVEQTKERAHFTSWSPQSLVLSHPSIGGFLSHGGWNSVLEAICNGVPMLLWPDFWDQKMHSEQAVAQWKVGLLLRRGSDRGHVVEAEEIEEMVRQIMQDGTGTVAGDPDREAGQGMGGSAETWKSKARLAHARHSGSSYNNTQKLVQLVQQKSASAV